MKKYLAYYENEWPENIAELTAVENKPFVGYLKGEGVLFTVIPEVLPDNEIWYTTNDGSIIPLNENYYGYVHCESYNPVVEHYYDEKGTIVFDSPVRTISGNYQEGFPFTSKVKNITSISIPCGGLGTYALYGASNLNNINLGLVEHLGESALRNCSQLTSVTIPKSVKSIKKYCFDGCNNLTNIQYEGTMSDWGNITLGQGSSSWGNPFNNIPATVIRCTDGDVTIQWP